MDIGDVRKRVIQTIDYAKRRAAERRSHADEGSRAYDLFLERTAVPLFRQIANVLRAESYAFNVFTPSGSVRLMSDRHAEDFIEIVLDATGGTPQVVGHVSRSRGRRVDESERALGEPAALTEAALLDFVLEELEPFVER